MRPASRRALLKRLEAAAPTSGARAGSVLAAVALAALLTAWLAGRGDAPPAVAPPATPSASVLDPVLALPFGQGSNNAAPIAAAAATRAEDLRATFRRAGDLAALYRQWRDQPEIEARYLAFRAGRDCDRLRRTGGRLEADAMGVGRRERERQVAAAVARCGSLISQPAPADELQQLARDAAAGGHPAAQVALAAETSDRRSLAETLASIRQGLGSGDPFAYDEARRLLAMSRHQALIGGVSATDSADDQRLVDARVVAIDIVGCRLGNPCGPSSSAAALDCGDNLVCQRDAEAWVTLAAGLDNDEVRQAQALAEVLLSAFRRGAVDEIVRLPGAAYPPR